MIFSLQNISKHFGADPVLLDISIQMEDQDRIGLIGANGAGKSTLLNIITGNLDPDVGTVTMSGKTVGFLRQNSGLELENTLIQEMRSVFSELLDMEQQIQLLAAELALNSTPELSARYADLQHLFEQREGYLIDVKIRTVLNGMGFSLTDPNTPVSVLSGGEKTRLALCKLLLEQPHLLILDEPTNHLDFKTLFWLEEYLLTSYKGALLTVSHDRYFLDRLCTRIWDLSDHRLTPYPGNYSRYAVQKKERDEQQRKEYEQQQEEIAQMKDFVARNMARASTTARAKSRQKALDRMTPVEKPKPPARPPRIRFQYAREPVKDVLTVKNLNLTVGAGSEIKQLLSGVDFSLQRGDRIALIGSNGVGKSTFLKALQNSAPHQSGSIEWGRYTEISWFEQEEFAMDSGKTAINELWDRFPRETELTIRSTMGAVGITGENVYKRVGDLSGGERAKLKFALLMLSCGNVLLMDEPTNHLDLAAREALEDALVAYTGTLLIVSHDRYLLSRIPQKIAEMHHDRIDVFAGGYAAWLEHSSIQQQSAPTRDEAATDRPKPTGGSYRGKKQRSEQAARRNRITQLEREIEQLEEKIQQFEQDIADPNTARDYEKLQQLCSELEITKVQLEQRLTEWSALSDDAE